jgi:hypothetical protein
VVVDHDVTAVGSEVESEVGIQGMVGKLMKMETNMKTNKGMDKGREDS